MIITNVQELRLCFPSHAIDTIDPYAGTIDNSEHDFLLEPLGLPLYEKMVEWYEANQANMTLIIDSQTSYYNRLVLMAQRCVAFDAMGRCGGTHGLSINNAGLNFATADDYPRADDKAVQQFRATCQKEAHASLNRLLYTLEQWCKNMTPPSPPAQGGESQDPLSPPAQGGDESGTEVSELTEICTLWRQSRYYYLAASMLISSAQLMQEYLNIYDSREKFIQMLPDLRFIQEEQIAPAIGEEFVDFMVHYAAEHNVPLGSAALQGKECSMFNVQCSMLDKILHKLRKIAATMMEGRTQILKIDDRRRTQAHDEGVLLLGRLCDMLRANQSAILDALGESKASVFTSSPLYVKPAEHQAPHSPSEGEGAGGGAPEPCPAPFENNKPGSALFVTPPLL